MVLLEAMRASKPVIAARAGGAPEIVEEERSGLLFHPGDSSDLARQIGRLVSDPHLRMRLGQEGYERWRSGFSLDAMSSRTASLYVWLWSRSIGTRVGPPAGGQIPVA